ncbi:hypothetical protein FB566_4898 [Stackebrandtia endophytica]|uniref:DUF2567 domain-containing protein n=1 Tax=Stackebrandtia endophytica TaxID=1496996 RepID=A0A543B390_9ACTN|nr:hypothetical protein [Stackebrandtia endophytica]TQL79297.1 hypothetical protein FB566_4898 [Stackebrandtia endophytica]
MSQSPHTPDVPGPAPVDAGAPPSPPLDAGLEPPRTTGADLRAAGLVVAVLAFLGLPLGAVWGWLTPKVELVRVAAGFGLTKENPEEYMAADGVFALLGFGAGIVAAVVVWALLSARRGPWLLGGLVVGSIGSQVMAWQFGKIGRDEYLATLDQIPVGWHVWRAPELKMVSFDVGAAFEALAGGDIPGMFANLSIGVLATMAFSAAFVYTVCAGWSRYPRLRAAEEPVEAPSMSHDTPPMIRNAEATPPEGRLPSLTC